MKILLTRLAVSVALQPESLPFLQALATGAQADRDALVAAISADPTFAARIQQYGQLGAGEQKALRGQVIAVEVKSFGIAAPVLIIDTTTISNASFFGFDPAVPGAGRVILNPEKIAGIDNPYAGLMLLIHETRHSAQFQLATSGAAATGDPLARGYLAAFTAQKKLKGKPGFCDSLTLNKELEAFQFGNYVVGALTGWTIDSLDMGT